MSSQKNFVLIVIFLTNFLIKIGFCVNVYTCGNEIKNQKQFLIQSDLNLEKNYKNNQKCEILINSDQNCDNVFNFQFLQFDLENSLGCIKDRLEIFNQDAICGSKSGIKNYVAQNGELKVRFITDESNSGKGFQILVTKQPCNTSVEQIPNCCANEYRLRRFYLASPNFPHPPKQKNDCIYIIFRANPNICRLRIHFKYFSTPNFSSRNDCGNAFLEIDGKRFCGCKTGLNIISNFDKTYQNNPKVIRYVNEKDQNYFRGFILEIIQDECPDKLVPESRFQKPQLYYYNDQLNKVETNLNDAKMLSGEVMDSNLNRNSDLVIQSQNVTDDSVKGGRPLNRSKRSLSAAKPIYHYYFYEAPDEQNAVVELKEAESRNYYDILLDQIPNFDENICTNWGVYEFKQITEDILWKQMPKCGSDLEENGNDNCCIIEAERGYLYTPGYPFYYGRNLNLCYRFKKGNSCGFKIFVLDFGIEASYQCHKDAFILYNQRYCGYSLMRSQFIINLSKREFEDIRFVTDNTYCGRGFQLYFQKLPCSTPTATTPINYNCGGEIAGRQQFEIAIPKTGYDCVYNIRKFERDVCRMQLFFNSDLDCRAEYLLIQNKQYCGYLQGKNVTVDFTQTDVIRIFYHSPTMSPVMSSVLIRGQQINRDCYDEPPAQRIFTNTRNPSSYKRINQYN